MMYISRDMPLKPLSTHRNSITGIYSHQQAFPAGMMTTVSLDYALRDACFDMVYGFSKSFYNAEEFSRYSVGIASPMPVSKSAFVFVHASPCTLC